jgi:hypothetical protein
MSCSCGVYGISVFAVRDATVDELAQQAPLVRFDRLSLLTVRDVLPVGMRLEATGRDPRHFTVGFDVENGQPVVGRQAHEPGRSTRHIATVSSTLRTFRIGTYQAYRVIYPTENSPKVRKDDTSG